MFASNPMKLIFENGEITDFEQKRNPFAWVFFLACQKTGEAMEMCKKELGDDFLFYWDQFSFNLWINSEYASLVCLDRTNYSRDFMLFTCS